MRLKLGALSADNKTVGEHGALPQTSIILLMNCGDLRLPVLNQNSGDQPVREKEIDMKKDEAANSSV